MYAAPEERNVTRPEEVMLACPVSDGTIPSAVHTSLTPERSSVDPLCIVIGGCSAPALYLPYTLIPAPNVLHLEERYSKSPTDSPLLPRCTYAVSAYSTRADEKSVAPPWF